MVKQLLWKEWHEQRWKLIFGTVMLMFFTGALMAARVSTNHEMLIVVWVIGGLVLALYSAMGVFAPEVSNETQNFLMSKPIQPWAVFGGKLFMGWLNFAVPMLICSLGFAIITLIHPQERFFELKFIAKGTFAGVCFGTMLYTMACCLAPRKSGEAMAGFTGLIICVVFMLHMVIAMMIIDGWRHPFPFHYESVLYLNPIMWINFMSPLAPDMHLWLLVIEQLVLFVLTIMCGYRRWQRN